MISTLQPMPFVSAEGAVGFKAAINWGLFARMAALIAGAIRLAWDATNESPSTRRLASGRSKALPRWREAAQG